MGPGQFWPPSHREGHEGGNYRRLATGPRRKKRGHVRCHPPSSPSQPGDQRPQWGWERRPQSPGQAQKEQTLDTNTVILVPRPLLSPRPTSSFPCLHATTVVGGCQWGLQGRGWIGCRRLATNPEEGAGPWPHGERSCIHRHSPPVPCPSPGPASQERDHGRLASRGRLAMRVH